MPQPSGRFYPPDEVAARLDELKRVVAGKEGPYIRGESDRSRPYGHAPSRSRSRESRGDLPNLRALSDDASAHGSDDTSADSEEFYQVPWPANLEVLQVLGEGASGQVAKVRLRSTGQVLARKVIASSPDPAVHHQLLRELNMNRACRSDFIVQYYDAYFEPRDATISILMEYCEGGSLDAIYRRVKSRGGRIGEKVLAKLAENILHGLDYLHSCRIIHRDVKPANILVTLDGRFKLCDFGVAGELIDSMAGTFTGTCTYMAGLSYTITSDVWSLGVTMLELALNRYLFTTELGDMPSPMELLACLLHAPLPVLEDDPAHGVKWSRALRDFLDHCLVRDGVQRVAPRVLLHHPLIKRAQAIPSSDIARFLGQVWDWPSP